ncbi:unnamed protein product [Cuscuta campestris]|uniref:Phospholipid scramblase n=1 Tax=Cuscuta campestris TaxID=132261 RepID=A0A484MFM9_9ASTE|nr:unnamed protein product [Cuscuta campestris]
MLSTVKLSDSIARNIQCVQHPLKIVSRQFCQGARNDPDLSRDFFVQLWVADRKMQKAGIKHRTKTRGALSHDDSGSCSFSGGSDELKPKLRQPPVSETVTGFLQPSSPEEAMVACLLARSNLLITRDIEWANLVLGFEQENRYAIVDVYYPQSPAGYIREKSSILARQVDVGNFLRFKSCVLYTELENPCQPLINVEVVAHVTRPELRSSEVSNKFYFTFSVCSDALKNGLRIRNVVPATEAEARRVIERMDAES